MSARLSKGSRIGGLHAHGAEVQRGARRLDTFDVSVKSVADDVVVIASLSARSATEAAGIVREEYPRPAYTIQWARWRAKDAQPARAAAKGGRDGN